VSLSHGNPNEKMILVRARDGIRLLVGAARAWDSCLEDGWIRQAVRAGPILYYRYRDIVALAERLCREHPPGLITVGTVEGDRQ
jgi:hypothetical protein